MASDNFVDYVKIFTQSGNGGAGSQHKRRERFIPKGGPDGGDGGRGGHVIIRGNEQMWTLLPLKYKKHIKATHGRPGEGNKKTGADGTDVYIDVPVGTVVKDSETEQVLFEIEKDKEEKILRKGGKGGRGNCWFKTSTNQMPEYAQPGEKGSEGWVILELKVLADVGLVGFPNVGKSTLLSVVSAAKPEIANYPFTTLRPNLGIVKYYDDKSFIMADIPGIIEGASQGKGLGLRFLRHIERNSILLFMIPSDSKNIKEEYGILLGEMEEYNPELLDKKRILSISKSDLLDEELEREIAAELTGMEVIFFSSKTGRNLDKLKQIIWNNLH